MKEILINDMVVRFANVNGTGSASANEMFAKSVLKMGIPVSPKNIFPSNIQGLPTWYEVRVSEKGYLARRDGIDMMVAVNPQSFAADVRSVRPGGYLLYDSSKPLPEAVYRPDITFLGVPMMRLCMEHYTDPRQQQLFKNLVYVGALVALLDIEEEVVKGIISEQFAKKPQLIPPNFEALDLGINFAKQNFDCPLHIRVQRRDLIGDRILIDGNAATALGAVYGGATVMAWYPITPSTSVASAFEKYCKKLRVDPATGQNNYAFVQAEDELAAVGMVVGASWNGARAFTATSGPGISLMTEFIGLAYFAEIPVVIVDVQRGGPSTGMPTRTQQSDLISVAYASHGDTKHIMLFPCTPTECFELSADAFDFAERFQTPVFLMTDLDLGMNVHLTAPFTWYDNRKYDRGKVLSAADLETYKDWGRYKDDDGDGIAYRTLPGTHPSKGAFFTRGSSRDEYARYTEDGTTYQRVFDRLNKKWETAKGVMPGPEFYQSENRSAQGLVFFGTTTYAALEAMQHLEEQGLAMDAMRVRAFPFNDGVAEFIANHDEVFVIEQNRDGQFRTLLINELGANPGKLISVLNYDGTPITAAAILRQLQGVEV
jgi:2-oxoglutarate ferredoxin oxidoreductase subunit alpha